jgi:hypothetical protein
VVIPKWELEERIPQNPDKIWHLYLWVCKNSSCFQVRGLKTKDRWELIRSRERDQPRDFSNWLENWKALDELTA